MFFHTAQIMYYFGFLLFCEAVGEIQISWAWAKFMNINWNLSINIDVLLIVNCSHVVAGKVKTTCLWNLYGAVLYTYSVSTSTWFYIRLGTWGQEQKWWAGREYHFVRCCIDKYSPNWARSTPNFVKMFFIIQQYWRMAFVFQTTLVCKTLFNDRNGEEDFRVHSACSQICACRSSWLWTHRTEV